MKGVCKYTLYVQRRRRQKNYVHKFLPIYLEFELKEAIRAKIRIK